MKQLKFVLAISHFVAKMSAFFVGSKESIFHFIDKIFSYA